MGLVLLIAIFLVIVFSLLDYFLRVKCINCGSRDVMFDHYHYNDKCNIHKCNKCGCYFEV